MKEEGDIQRGDDPVKCEGESLAGPSGLSQKLLDLRFKAKQGIESLPASLRSNDVLSFCKLLLPALLQPLQPAHPHAQKDPDGLVDLKKFSSWDQAFPIIAEAFHSCASSIAAGRESDSSAGKEGKIAKESMVQGEVLRLAGCERCGRVVLQRRFAAHWQECSQYEYDKDKQANGNLKLKLPNKPQPKLNGPTKFGLPNVSKGTAIGSKRRKVDGGTGVEGEAPLEIEIEVITCDGCGLSPITGSRFSCNECDDFDLCQACHARGLPADRHDPSHTFCLVAIPVVSAPNAENVHPGGSPLGKGDPGKLKKANTLDLDRICGVMLETGGRCMRTIDCKAHTQVAKREVTGRSRPYDELLAERKAFKANQQAAALAAPNGAMALRAQKGRQERSEEEDEIG
eukprot:307070-Hanusia_phi.AAC.1